MTKQEVEKNLRELREAEVRARHELAGWIDKEQKLNTERESLSLSALGGDVAAQAALKSIKKKRFDAQSEREDLETGIKKLEIAIVAAEQAYESAIRDDNVEAARALLAERGKVAARIQDQANKLTSVIADYNRIADELAVLVNELQLPNGSTRALRGTPMLRDFLQHQFAFIFPSDWSDESQRVPLVELERMAKETLEFSIRSTMEAA